MRSTVPNAPCSRLAAQQTGTLQPREYTSIAMTRIAAVQLGKYGISVNAVCPGITETELMTAWLESRAREGRKPKHDLIKELLADSALLRINTALDVAQAVLFLVSDASRNITGQSLNVDSGMMWD